MDTQNEMQGALRPGTLPFEGLPGASKKAVGFLVAGWIWALAGQIWSLKAVPVIQILFGLFLVISVLKVKDWGRMLCIFANFIILGANFAVAVKFGLKGSFVMSGVSLGTAALFSLSTYYLLKKETSEFFKREESTRG